MAMAGLGWSAGATAQNHESTDNALAHPPKRTGSRIPRDDAETPLPVWVFDRETLDRSGEISVADFLRDMPINSFGSRRPPPASTAQSVAGIDLRGLGETRTLVLIDGRRWPVAPSVGSVLNLNSVPLAAVERIEILAEGASAIYGSDAIGGVVNIVTRKQRDGVELRLGVGDPRRAGGETEEGSVLFGVSDERGSVLGGVSYANRGLVLSRDRDYSSGGLSLFANNFMRADPLDNSYYGFRAGALLNHPVNGSRVPGPDACNGPGFSATATRCFYDFAQLTTEEAETRHESLFTRASFEINDDWTTYLDATVSRLKSFGRLAPSVSFPWPGVDPSRNPNYAFIPVGSPNHPAVRFPDAGYNPATPVFLRHRFAGLGSRDTSSDENVYDVQLGFQGRIGGFDLTFGGHRSESKYLQLGRNYLVGAIAEQYVNDGRYDIYNPYGNSRAVLDAMSATINRDAGSAIEELFVDARRDLFKLPGGSASLVAGLEYRQESYVDRYNTLQSSGQIIGASGNSAWGDRRLRAAYAELFLPLSNELDLALAGRYDEYSAMGSDVSPKLSLGYRPLDTLSLRASYGQGFAAPDLGLVSMQPSLSYTYVCDNSLGFPKLQCAPTESYLIANPELRSEQATQIGTGLDWNPTKGLGVSLDYYDIAIDDRIAAISSELIFDCLLGHTACPAGVELLPLDTRPPQPQLGLGMVYDPAGSTLPFIQRGYANFGTLETRGIDLRLDAQFDFATLGVLNSRLQLSRVLDYRVDRGADRVGDPSFPKFRAGWHNDWTRGDFSLAWTVQHIDGTLSTAGMNVLSGSDDDYGYPHRLPSWTTHALQASWNAPWNGRISVGVQNVGDKGPVLDPLSTTGSYYDFRLYDGYGRVPYLRYQHSF